MKVRQPLRRAVIVASGAEREAIERLEPSLVKTELNVKELEFVSEEAELVSYDVKPNYRSLGPRFGKLMPQAAAAIEALDAASVADAIAGERKVGINVDGKEHELEPEDLSLVMRPLDGYQRGGGVRSTRSRSPSSWTTSCSARGWPGRSSTRFRTPVATPASR